MARAVVSVSDRGFKALLERIGAANNTLIRAGVFAGPPREPEHHRGAEVGAVGEQPTNAEVAAIHEFGLGVPERSFVRGTVDANRTEIQSRLREMGGSLFDPRSPREIEQEAKKFGEWFVGEMKTRIREGIEPALAESTIEEKGSSTPLIDSGQLWSSLTYDVAVGGGKRERGDEGGGE